jgi:hypothetical protein
MGNKDTDTENTNLVAGWQWHVDPELVKEEEWSDADTDPPTGRF